jgi:hypothetical protein
MTSVQQRQGTDLGDALYARYARPLEAEHAGRILAVSEAGETLLGDDIHDVLRRADAQFRYTTTYVFRIGEATTARTTVIRASLAADPAENVTDDAAKQERGSLGDRLYDQYARPLEAEHWGEFVAIAPDGRTMLGTDLWDLTKEAIDQLGKGLYVYKVGEKAVGRWRR